MSPQRRIAMTGKLSHVGLHRLLALLSRDNEQAYIVGGAVRNSLLGLPIDDIDIATSLPPEAVIDRVTTAGMRYIPTGIDHGTVTVIAEERPYEVTTFREDYETDGRHARVRFGQSLRGDAERRDFTINALYADASGFITDPVGGIDDINARHVRFIGDPVTRIREDYLRSLRFFRFTARYAKGEADESALIAEREDYLRSLRFFRFTARYAKGEADESALIAVDQERDGLSKLSRERIRAELMKLLEAPRVLYVLRLMAHRDLIDPVFGLPLDLEGFTRMLQHDPGADLFLRLTALAVHKPDDALTLRETMRLSNAETDRLEKLGEVLMQLSALPRPLLGEVLMQLSALPRPLNAKQIRKMAFRYGRRVITDALIVDMGRRDAKVDAELWTAAGSAPTHSPFTGAMVIKRGVPAGPLVGQIQATLKFYKI